MKISHDKIKITGEYAALSLAPWVERTSSVLNDIREALRTNNQAVIDTLKASGVILEVKYNTNLIPTTGRNVLARLLAGDTTYTGEVDYGALGHDATPAFSNASTTLDDEVYRSQADSQAFDDNIAYIDWFIAAGDVVDQTFEEFGAFIDGTASADTGQAWSLLKTGGWTKSGSMFISAKYTLV
jgi:hypothetical protein